MESLKHTISDFFSQPFGVVGAICIMVAVTAFNSKRIQGRLARVAPSQSAMSVLLNGLNLVGGACLLVNACIRNESVWVVLEIYFVAIAVKGLWQTRSTLAALRRGEQATHLSGVSG